VFALREQGHRHCTAVQCMRRAPYGCDRAGLTVHSFSFNSLEDPVRSVPFSVLQVPCLVLTAVGSGFLVLRWVRDRAVVRCTQYVVLVLAS